MRIATLALVIGATIIGPSITGPGAALADEAPFRVVSVVDYTPHEVLFEPTGAYEAVRRMVRVRLVAPQIADQDQFGFEVIEPDFQALCEGVGLDAVSKFAPNAREVVISVASRELPFGESAPNVVQYFDLFNVQGNTCVWGGL